MGREGETPDSVPAHTDRRGGETVGDVQTLRTRVDIRLNYQSSPFSK